MMKNRRRICYKTWLSASFRISRRSGGLCDERKELSIFRTCITHTCMSFFRVIEFISLAGVVYQWLLTTFNNIYHATTQTQYAVPVDSQVLNQLNHPTRTYEDCYTVFNGRAAHSRNLLEGFTCRATGPLQKPLLESATLPVFVHGHGRKNSSVLVQICWIYFSRPKDSLTYYISCYRK